MGLRKRVPTRKKPTKKRRGFQWPWRSLAIPAGLVLLLAVGSLGFAATTEEHDSFCASCHTQPESTFYSRSQSGAPVDLATAHQAKAVKCIDCHSGRGVTGRLGAIMLGSRNALAFFTRTAQQPAPLTWPIRDNNCIKCHEDTLTRQDFQNHFHVFLFRWQAQDPQAAGCVDCHTAHTTTGSADTGFMTQDTVSPVCQRCHTAIRGE